MERAWSENSKHLRQNLEKYTHLMNGEEQEFAHTITKEQSERENHSQEKNLSETSTV